jgi:hypothetical protein
MATGTSTAAEGSRLATDSMTTLHWAGVVLSLVTGGVHFYLAALFVPEGLGIAFLVAGVGYLVGVGAILVDFRRRLFYLLGIPFTLGQIVAWYAANGLDLSPTSVIDKVAQVLLIVVLVQLYRDS